MSSCKICNNWRNIYRMPIMWLLRPLFKLDACGQACGECGRLIWGRMPNHEPAEKSSARAIKRAKYGVKEPGNG